MLKVVEALKFFFNFAIWEDTFKEKSALTLAVPEYTLFR